MSQQIVILAAGKGTRMGGEIPKVLLPLNIGEPIILHLLNEIKGLPQDTKPVIVVGFKKEMVMDALGDEYIYVTQFDQKGTGHAVLSAKDQIVAENFIVLNGDMPFTTKESLQKLIDSHHQNRSVVSMVTVKLENFEGGNKYFSSWGRIIRNAAGEVNKIREFKDSTDQERLITEVNTGTYMFNSVWIWDKLAQITDDNNQHEFYLTDIIELAIKDGKKVNSLSIDPKEAYGINNPEDLDFARKLL
ncbi:NTP transferase domain-containing protein [bacterium]|nr:MAG: NTP transferase domain-containing protein [bacterium]